MNEPLNTSRPGISFSGKTYNKHPQWYNQPLRLTKEQKKDPLLVLDDFFECYHLNDVRKTLWEWTTEVLSSPCCISIEPQRRNDHIYFYEKIEGIIEAAFVMKNKIHKYRSRKEKRKFHKTVHSKANQFASPKIEISPIELKPDSELVEKDEILNKPKPLIEFVYDAPLYVIEEVFQKESLPTLINHLHDWLLIALTDDSSIYEDGEQRRQLVAFHEELLLLIEALFIICSQNLNDENKKEKLTVTNKITLLSRNQIENPLQVINAFYANFHINYIFRELDDWLEAGISYPGPYPENFSELQALHTYRNVLCLIKSGNRLLNK
jgi:hypothetical protein